MRLKGLACMPPLVASFRGRSAGRCRSDVSTAPHTPREAVDFREPSRFDLELPAKFRGTMMGL
jgi:hypothetical protein